MKNYSNYHISVVTLKSLLEGDHEGDHDDAGDIHVLFCKRVFVFKSCSV